MTFDDLKQGGLALLEYAVAQRVEETYLLEFKQKHNASDVELHKDDRRALGEALSGFANAIGGTLIIGVRTERPNGVDRAVEYKPIQNVSTVAERYRAYVNDCVSPQIDGVRVCTLADQSGSGAIIIEVPQGSARPHMSMAPTHQRYYRRVSDSFVPMLHYEIEEMMRLKTSPSLDFIWKLQYGGSIGDNKTFSLVFGLRNFSKATARFPFISYYSGENKPRIAEYGLDGNGNTLWPNLGFGSSDAITFAGGADRVIHPGQQFFVSKLDYADQDDPRFARYWGISNLVADAEIELKFDYGCEDCPIQTVYIRLTADKLRKCDELTHVVSRTSRHVLPGDSS
jgi:hypothetical protein